MNRGPGINKEHSDWDEQQQLLSAYLDGELTTAEREQLERHLSGCERCQTALAELRQMRALLRALPTPQVPRSFLLPETGPLSLSPVPSHGAAAPARLARRSAPSRGARLAQWVGGLAAAVGVGLAVGSFVLGGHPLTESAGSAAAPNAAPRQTTNGPAGSAQTPPHTSGPYGASHATASTSAAQPTPTPSQANNRPDRTPIAANVTVGEPPVLPITGAGLALGGVTLLVGGRIVERRRRTTTEDTE